MFSSRSALFLLALTACGGEEPCWDGSDPVEGVCPLECPTGYVVDGEACSFACDDGSLVELPEDCPSYFEPVAVGFSLYTGIEDGAFVPYRPEAGEDLVQPFVILKFAPVEYFSSTTAPYCEVFAELPEGSVLGTSMPVSDGGEVWSSYEFALPVTEASWQNYVYGDAAGPCAETIDPAIYGAGAADLLASFDGMRIGFGFGPSSATLEENMGESFTADVTDEMFTAYTAINDASGAWVGEPWSAALVAGWDAETYVPTVDAEDSYVFVAPDGAVPDGFLRTFDWWLQDFPLMDLGNLSDGAPQ